MVANIRTESLEGMRDIPLETTESRLMTLKNMIQCCFQSNSCSEQEEGHDLLHHSMILKSTEKIALSI